MRVSTTCLVLLAACGGQSGEYPIERPAWEPNFCSLTSVAASAVSLACPNVYDAPPGDRDADAMRERPAYEVQAYLGYTWGDEQEAFVEGALACGLNDHTFGQVDHDEDWGVVNADQCVDLKACLDEQGITFPDEWPETSYFDLLPEDEDICGLQTLQ